MPFRAFLGRVWPLEVEVSDSIRGSKSLRVDCQRYSSQFATITCTKSTKPVFFNIPGPKQEWSAMVDGHNIKADLPALALDILRRAARVLLAGGQL